MRDLYVYTADADAMGVIRAVLDRPKAIGIRAMDCEVDRHTGRDPGMVKDGPELVRFRKTAFQRALLIWDHEGSGWERRSPEEAQHEVRVRLDQCTWKDRSYAVVIVPELEEWLWHNPVSIARHLGVAVQRLEEWVADFAEKRKTSCDSCRQLTPKELLADMFYRSYRRQPLPGDFEQIAKNASLRSWQKSKSFALVVATLREWFPSLV